MDVSFLNLPQGLKSGKMNPKNYILRSLLFVPGNNEKLMKSASRTEADALILDLEDSVLESEKTIAREIIKEKVESGSFDNFQVFIRLNDIESGLLEEELESLAINGITGFILPKSQNGQDVFFIEDLLNRIEIEKGFPSGKFTIIPLIETTEAVLSIRKTCSSSKRIIAVCFGSEDFLNDLRGTHDENNIALLVPRANIALAARASGIIPIDTLHTDVHDLDDLEKNLKVSKTLGFEGMLLLHPKEIQLAHKYYTPSNEEYESAKEMLRLSEQANKQKKKVAIINGRFIGPPMIKTAKRIIKRFEMIKVARDK